VPVEGVFTVMVEYSNNSAFWAEKECKEKK